jgi:hypothetical protein
MKSVVRMLILMVGVASLATPMLANAEDGSPIPLHPPKAAFEDGSPIPLHPPQVAFEDGSPIPLHPPQVG